MQGIILLYEKYLKKFKQIDARLDLPRFLPGYSLSKFEHVGGWHDSRCQKKSIGILIYRPVAITWSKIK